MNFLAKSCNAKILRQCNSSSVRYFSAPTHATHKRASMEPDPWSNESTGSIKKNPWPFAIGMSIFILIMGVAVPKMLSNEQKKAMNAQRAHETYGFLKDPRSNPYADKEEEE